jgi:hypothetical protein
MKTYLNKLIKFYHNGKPEIGFVLEQWPDGSPYFLRILFQRTGQIDILGVVTSKPKLLEE